MANRVVLGKRKFGFTLIELIVALAVVGIGVTVLFQLFIVSLNINQKSNNLVLATCIAQDCLGQIITTPEKFHWQIPDNVKPGEVFPILTSLDEPKMGNRVEPPKIAPPDWASFKKYQSGFDKYFWKAFGRLSTSSSEVYEVTVVVTYKERGREQNYTLTSFVPVYRVNKATRSRTG